jgi:hypothetical protein
MWFVEVAHYTKRGFEWRTGQPSVTADRPAAWCKQPVVVKVWLHSVGRQTFTASC